MADTIVWAHRPLKRLRMQTGIVQCDEELAAQLLAEGLVQDPRVGALQLKEVSLKADAEPEEEGDVVVEAKPQVYTTRQLKAKK